MNRSFSQFKANKVGGGLISWGGWGGGLELEGVFFYQTDGPITGWGGVGWGVEWGRGVEYYSSFEV